MNEKNHQLTEGSIWKGLLRFAFPLFLGNLFQQLYNLVDSLVVGNFCGNDALAAVSSSGNLCFLMIGFFQGVFTGASVIISQRFGAKDEDGVDVAIHNTVFFAVIMGIALSVLGVLFTPQILRWMGTPENVMPNSVLYFRIYCMGLLGLVLYNTATGIFQALGDSKHPLYYLMIASFVNVVLDLLFVVVFDMGVAGTALATIIGQAVSAVLAMLHLMSGRFIITISLHKIRPKKAVLRKIFGLGIPTGIQNSVIALANVVVQTNINAFGANAMAGCGSYSKIEGFMFIPTMCISLALTTFVGQNLGAGKTERVKKGAVIGMGMAFGMATLFGVFFRIFAPNLLQMFSDNPEVIAIGVAQVTVEGLFYGFCAYSHAVAGILRGAGKTTAPMLVMLIVWCVIRIIYITIMVKFIFDIRIVFTAYPLTWIISSVIYTWLYKKGNWMLGMVEFENKK